MTRQESFKRRIRERMAKTGERYAAARRNLIDQSGARTWISQPEVSEEAVRAATGRGWEDWCDLIDGWPGHTDGHTAIAAHLQDAHGVDGWWAQTVTVGWERITGRRLPHQQPDGTFTAGKSRTITIDPDQLRAMLLDDHDRADLLGGLEAVVRSDPTAKTIRLGIGGGIAQVAIAPTGDGRAKVTVQHAKLDSIDDVDRWKHFWEEWLAALDEG